MTKNVLGGLPFVFMPHILQMFCDLHRNYLRICRHFFIQTPEEACLTSVKQICCFVHSCGELEIRSGVLQTQLWPKGLMPTFSYSGQLGAGSFPAPHFTWPSPQLTGVQNKAGVQIRDRNWLRGHPSSFLVHSRNKQDSQRVSGIEQFRALV